MGCSISLKSVVIPFLTVVLANCDTFHIGYISGSRKPQFRSAYDRPGYQISGAISLALNEINEKHPDGLLQGHRLDFEYAETFGQESESMKHTARFCVNNFSVIIGPQETCMREARLASNFDKLMLSYFCPNALKSGEENPKMYSTFVSMKPPLSQVGKPLASLLLKYNWRKVTFLYNRESGALFGESIQKVLEKEGLTILKTETWTGPYFAGTNFAGMPVFSNPFKKIVQQTKDRTRIYVIVGSIEEHIGFMEAMGEARLPQQGLHFVVGVYQEQYRPGDPFRYLSGKFTETPKPETMDAFRSFAGIIPTPAQTAVFKLNDFTNSVNYFATLPPFNFTWESPIQRKVRVEAAYLYDAVMLYANALQECLAARDHCPDPHNGTQLVQHFLDRSYHSVMGYGAYIDKHGIAQGNYSLLALRSFLHGAAEKEKFGLLDIGLFLMGQNRSDLPSLEFKADQELTFSLSATAPLDEPLCGFEDERCKTHWGLLVAVITGTSLLILTLGICYYRHMTYKRELERLTWKIEWKDLNVERIREYLEKKYGSGDALNSMNTLCSSVLDSEAVVELQSVNLEGDIEVGVYKSELVAVKRVPRIRTLDLSGEIKEDLNYTKNLTHSNLCDFIGLCTDPACLVTDYCQRGCLNDALYGQFFPVLDTSFTYSFVLDIVKGMTHLLSSKYKTHGSLMPTNLLIDSKFTVKITNFGLFEFQKRFKIRAAKPVERLLWTAPELLRLQSIPLEGTASGDVYSFGIVLYEIVGREGPFGLTGLSAAEILSKVRSEVETLRPSLARLVNNFTPDYLLSLMEDCWSEEPHLRPSFPSIGERLKPLRKGMKPTILDNMVFLLHKYATNLENQVAERTKELQEEKLRTESLLYEMLPRPVAEKLIRGQLVKPEHYASVTIFFSDIVGFTSLSAGSTPFEVVDFLNDLYTLFDRLLECHDAYKVETIGDSYMMVSGLPVRNGTLHAGIIADLALHLLQVIRSFRIRHRPSQPLLLRIGIHTGPVVAGIVGIKMPRFCLFGDTVNTASRYESTGLPLKIHCSAQCKGILDQLGEYRVEKRGVVAMKGKGEQVTYWVVGRTDNKTTYTLQQSSSTSELLYHPGYFTSSRTPAQADIQRRWSNVKHPVLTSASNRHHNERAVYFYGFEQKKGYEKVASGLNLQVPQERCTPRRHSDAVSSVPLLYELRRSELETVIGSVDDESLLEQ